MDRMADILLDLVESTRDIPQEEYEDLFASAKRDLLMLGMGARTVQMSRPQIHVSEEKSGATTRIRTVNDNPELSVAAYSVTGKTKSRIGKHNTASLAA